MFNKKNLRFMDQVSNSPRMLIDNDYTPHYNSIFYFQKNKKIKKNLKQLNHFRVFLKTIL